MRAVVFDQPGDESVLRVGEVEAPALGTNELRLRVAAAGVNRADLLQRRGLYPPPPGASSLLGLECAGEVVEVGPAVRGWKPGERAMALLAGGGYAEEVAVDAGSALPRAAGPLVRRGRGPARGLSHGVPERLRARRAARAAAACSCTAAGAASAPPRSSSASSRGQS